MPPRHHNFIPTARAHIPHPRPRLRSTSRLGTRSILGKSKNPQNHPSPWLFSSPWGQWILASDFPKHQLLKMRFKTQFIVDPKTGSTFFWAVEFNQPSYDWKLLAHLAWVLNAYLPAQTVLRLLRGTQPIPHSVLLAKHLSPGMWKNLMALR